MGTYSAHPDPKAVSAAAGSPAADRPAAPGLRAPLYSADAIGAVGLGWARCVLALVFCAVVIADPATSADLEALAPASALAYLAWTISVLVTAARGRALPTEALCWVDAAFYSWLIWLADGGDGVFFICYVFPIVAASFSSGLRSGLVMTFACAASLIVLGTIAMPTAELTEARAFVRPAFLAILGSLIAYCGGRELRSKRELLLLHALCQAPDFRRSNEARISQALDWLCELDRAGHAFLLTGDEGCASVHSSGPGAGPAGPLNDAARGLLLGAPDHLAIAYRHTRDARTSVGASAYSVRDGMRRVAAPVEWCAKAATFLNAAAFMCVPYADGGSQRGRLYIIAPRAFSSADLAFAVRFSAALAALVDHAQLVEELASTAVERERSRISLDIHDTTIQPYIGLRMGLEALLAEVESEGDVKGALRELVEMADLAVKDLRLYAAGLRAGPRSDGTLIAAVTEQAGRYARFYGVNVRVDIDKLRLPPHVAAEIFQILSEGLSNVRRHTNAGRASVRVRRVERMLHVEIRNETTAVTAPRFTPRSIQQRAAMLGGTVSVTAGDGETVVTVTVPL